MNNSSNKIENELVVTSTTENLSAIRTFIKSSAARAGLTNEMTNKIILAVDEACTNIIKHAYKYSPKGKISIRLTTENEKISISITDEGGHFDPTLIPEPDLKKLQKEKRSGGLGMFLMKRLMDEVTYSNLPDNRNQVVLVKYRN